MGEGQSIRVDKLFLVASFRCPSHPHSGVAGFGDSLYHAAKKQELTKVLTQMPKQELTQDRGAQPWVGVGGKQRLNTVTSPTHVALRSQKRDQALEVKKNLFISREGGPLLFSVGGIFISLHEGISKHR